MKFKLGADVLCDLATLVDTRLLIQASSGSGKSWALRRILEQTSGQVQQIIIDPEGEFHTLREKYDYIYAAPHGGDTVAHPRSAPLLAERLLELGVSAIIDIFELKPPTRREFVRRFFEALVEVPKRLYHPVIVALDEAHDYAPEGQKCESTAAVVDEASRGRKRGQCLILATQRISKLSKDAAAELKNRMIGGTFLDVDMKRAADELGTDKEGMRKLRELAPGQFWAFGPALTRVPTLVGVGQVETTHPKPGARLTAPIPPTPERVKALLPKLADLPAEAEQKQRTEAELKKDLAAARAAITRLERAAPVPTSTPIDTTALRHFEATVREQAAHIEKLTQALERLMKFIVEINAQDFFKAGGEKVDQAAIQKAIDGAAQQLLKLVEQDLVGRRKAFERWRQQGEQILAQISRLVNRDVKISVAVRHNEPFTVTSPKPAPARAPRAQPIITGEAAGLAAAQRKILNALAFLEQVGYAPPDRTQVSLFAGLSPTAGHTSNMFGGLRTAGLIEYLPNGKVRLTDAGHALADPGQVPQTAEEMQAYLLGRVAAAQRKLLTVLIAAYPNAIDKREAAERAGLSPDAGHTSNMLGGLRSLGVIDYPESGTVVALPVLFLEGVA